MESRGTPPRCHWAWEESQVKCENETTGITRTITYFPGVKGEASAECEGPDKVRAAGQQHMGQGATAIITPCSRCRWWRPGDAAQQAEQAQLWQQCKLRKHASIDLDWTTQWSWSTVQHRMPCAASCLMSVASPSTCSGTLPGDEMWEAASRAHTDLHAAAYALDPEFHKHQDGEEVILGYDAMLRKLLPDAGQVANAQVSSTDYVHKRASKAF